MARVRDPWRDSPLQSGLWPAVRAPPRRPRFPWGWCLYLLTVALLALAIFRMPYA